MKQGIKVCICIQKLEMGIEKKQNRKRQICVGNSDRDRHWERGTWKQRKWGMERNRYGMHQEASCLSNSCRIDTVWEDISDWKSIVQYCIDIAIILHRLVKSCLQNL